MTSPLAGDQALLIIPTDGEPSEDVVRSWVAGALVGVPLLPRLRAALVVDELVSNARRHGRLPCVLRLSLDHTGRYLLVFVEDSAPDDGRGVAGPRRSVAGGRSDVGLGRGVPTSGQDGVGGDRAGRAHPRPRGPAATSARRLATLVVTHRRASA